MPIREQTSTFELKRRRKGGDSSAELALRRDELHDAVLSLQRAVSSALLVLVIALLIWALGWLVGLFVALIVAAEYGSVARLQLIHRRFQPLYDKNEQAILLFVERYRRGAFRLVTYAPTSSDKVPEIASREELEQLLRKETVLAESEKQLLLHGLTFGERRVIEIMTPRSVIDSINEKELLGPLVLDDLHKTGHSRFPVIQGDIDHVVGVLHIRDLFVLDAKQRSTTAAKAMEPRVFYIREDQSLQSALAAFLRTHHHLFVVVNEFRETVGLLSLEDVIEALLGRRIIDEFDAHDDLRAVAAHNSHANNEPRKHEDV
jgi:CBS domain containing-hemolysin-like protein